VTLNSVSHYIYGWVSSDSRKRVMASPSVSTWRSRDQSYGGEATLPTSLNLASNAKLSFSPGYTWGMLRKLWVTNVDSDGDGADDHFVFGDLNERILDLTTRADLTLSPSLSFQIYAQPYLAEGHYERFDEILVPKTYMYAPYDLGYSPDFNDKSLRGNAVLRWEYRPGSTLYLVWSQSRYEGIANPGDFSPRRDLSTLMRTQGENVFMMKANYWFNL